MIAAQPGLPALVNTFHIAAMMKTTATNPIAAVKADNPNPAQPATAAKPATWANTAPTAADLWSTGKATGQSNIKISAEEMKNAKNIVETGQKLGLQPRAWVIALSTAMQESKLKNLGHLGSATGFDVGAAPFFLPAGCV